MKKRYLLGSLLLITMALTVVLASCNGDAWRTKFDLSLPDFENTYATHEEAKTKGGGWYLVFDEQFEENKMPERWTHSPHALRWKGDTPEQDSYWCPDMITFNNGMVEIRSEQKTDHVCSEGICPSVGRFSSGIETRKVVGDNSQNKGTSDEMLFAQAFGYFEARVKLPDADGLWSAFWLQSSNMRKLGNAGKDGTEIDIYESAFRQRSIQGESVMGHALLWNGYGNHGRVKDKIIPLEQDLYDGFHTFALKWTPDSYVFYIDGVATWASNGGGVSRVQEFLRLTVEIDEGDGKGPHGQTIGQFMYDEIPIFYIDYVKVYQNTEFAKYEKADHEYKGKLDGAN